MRKSMQLRTKALGVLSALAGCAFEKTAREIAPGRSDFSK